MAMGWFKTYIDVIGSFTTLAGGLLTLLSSIPEKKHRRLAITGGALALVGGFLTFLASQSSSHSVAAFQRKVLQNATDINTQVSDASLKLKELQQNLGDEKKAVGDLTGDVKSGTQRLLGATRQVSDALTGGSNYCYIQPTPEPPADALPPQLTFVCS